MRLIFATHNADKLREVRELIGHKYEVISLSELGDHENIPENELTLEVMPYSRHERLGINMVWLAFLMILV